jgi:hypothetical protein
MTIGQPSPLYRGPEGGSGWGATCHANGGFYASWCINRKADGGLELPAKIVQQRLGHSSIMMTMDIYGHLFPSDDDGAALAEAERALLGNADAPRLSGTAGASSGSRRGLGHLPG